MAGRKKLPVAEPGTAIQMAEKTPHEIAAREMALGEHLRAASELFGIPPEATQAELLDIGVHEFNAAGYRMARAGAAFGACQNRFDKTLREIADQSGVSYQHIANAIQLANYIESLPADQARRMLAVPYTKVLAIANAEPEVVADLLDDGALDGDSPLSVRDLRAALKRAQDEIEKRDEDIDRLKDERTRARREWVKAQPDARITKLRANVRSAADAVLLALSADNPANGLHCAIATLLEDEDAGEQDHTAFLAGLFSELIGAACLVRDNLPVSVPILEPRAPKPGSK